MGSVKMWVDGGRKRKGRKNRGGKVGEYLPNMGMRGSMSKREK